MKHFQTCEKILNREPVQREDLISFLSDFVDKIKGPEKLLPALITGIDMGITDLPEVMSQYYRDTNVVFCEVVYQNKIIKHYIYKHS